MADYSSAEDLAAMAGEGGESHGSAGEALRQARLAVELTIEDVAVETRIPTRVLRAIEAGDFTDPLSRPGAIAYASVYAQRFGHDPLIVAREVRAALQGTAKTPDLPEAHPTKARDHFVIIMVAMAVVVSLTLAATLWGLWQRLHP